MTKLLKVFVCLLLCVGMLDLSKVQAVSVLNENDIIENDESGIPDRLLYRLILDKCDNNRDGKISVEEAENVTVLRSNNFGITNLKGIDNLLNLRELELKNENIKTTKDLSGLMSLTNLDLEGSQISDLSGIAGLTSLRMLRLGKNNISDISSLRNLVNIEELTLDENGITDISALSNMTVLNALYINDNKITDLSAMRNLGSLERLEAYNNNITDISGLSGALNLDTIKMWRNNISDISALSSLKKVTYLDLSLNNINSIAALENMNQLNVLYMEQNNISDLSPIQNAIYLKGINVADNNLTSLPDLRLLTNLTTNNDDDYAHVWGLSRFSGNKLTTKELRTKLPKQLATDESWIAANKYVLSDVENLKLVSKGASETKIQWDKNAEASKYEIYRADNGWYGFKKIATVDANTLTYVDKSLMANTQYAYKIRAYTVIDDETCYSDYSQELTLTTKTATPEDIKVTANTSTSLKISWSSHELSDRYQLYRSTSKNGKYVLIGEYDNYTESVISKSLQPGQTYYYKVRAYANNWDEKNYSEFSQIVSGTPKLTAPKNVKASANTSTSLKISWDKVDGGTYYQVYRSTSKDGKYALLGVYDNKTASSISRSLATGKTYYYKVRTYCWVNGERVFSPFSTPITGKPVLQKSSKVTATPSSNTTAKITWNKIEGATYYQVYRGTSSTGKYALLGVYDNKTSSSVSRSLKKGQTYYYKVRGYKWVNGERVFSPFSTPVKMIMK